MATLCYNNPGMWIFLIIFSLIYGGIIIWGIARPNSRIGKWAATYDFDFAICDECGFDNYEHNNSTTCRACGAPL